MKVLLCFLTLLAAVLCQDCDFTTFYQCVGSRNDTNDPMATMKAAMESCFTNAGCTVPQKPSNTVEECKRQVHKTAIQACVQAQFPSFSFPAWKNSNQEGGWHGHDDNHGGSGEKRANQGFQAIVNQSCPDSTSAQSVQSCMDNLRSTMQQQLQSVGSRGRPSPSSMKSQMCSKLTTCVNQLSSTCQTQWTQIKSQLCTCTQNEISSSSTDADAQIQACYSSTGGTAQPIAASSSGWNKRNRGGDYGGRQMGRGQGQGKMGRGDEGLQKMAEWFCKDPCADN